MRTSKVILWLSSLVAVLAVVAAGAGLAWQDGGAPFSYTTPRGQSVEMYGRGLYRYDTIAYAAQAKAQDAVTLVLGVPLLAFSLTLYWKSSLRGHLLLTGVLGYFLYTYASMAFLAAYNQLFLVYVALFSASLFGFVRSFTSIDQATLPAHFSTRLPRRAIAGFLFVVGAFLLFAWLGLILQPLLQGKAPEKLESTTTLVIQALDLGIITPLAFLAGILLLKRTPLGYLLSATLLIKMLTMGTAVSAMVVGQLLAGVALTPGEIAPFPILSMIGISMTIALLRSISDAGPAQAAHA